MLGSASIYLYRSQFIFFPKKGTLGNRITSVLLSITVILDGPTNSAPFTLTPVKNAMIDSLAVTSPKMADNSITSSKIQDGQVATSDVANGAITSNKLDSNSVIELYFILAKSHVEKNLGLISRTTWFPFFALSNIILEMG